ncbi:MAG: FAD-dependent oxidoreductase [Kineosporiaceae bacterium]
MTRLSGSVTDADVVVVGGGLEGCAAAWELARRGAGRIVVLERSTVASGMTAKSSGIVRCHYSVPSLAAMAWAGVGFLERAGELLGQDIGFHQTGYVVGVGEADVEVLAANVAMQQSLGVEVDLVDAGAVAAMWPVARLDDIAGFAQEPRGGYGDGYRTATAFAAAARGLGVQVRQNATVVRLLRTAEGAVAGVLLADGEHVRAPQVVVAAGPWSPELVAGVGVDLPVRAIREEIVLVSPGRQIAPMPVLSDLVTLQYLRPEPGGEILVGNSDLSDPEPADPDGYRNAVSDTGLERAVEKLAHRLPGLPDASFASGYAGCYDVTPDWNPVISRTEVEGLTIAAGFSGHGFKIAPAVAHLVADLVLEGVSSVPEIPESDFRLSRFAEGDPLVAARSYATAGRLR